MSERLIGKVWAWLLTQLQDRCAHDPRNVAADIMEGADQEHAVRWCRICGAYQHYYVIGPSAARASEWRRPRPLWGAR